MNLDTLSTLQLREIKRIAMAGVPAVAEDTTAATSQLCHKSPPKGYPKDKSEYGDGACYRYPLNTKARCLAAWRYVHQKGNWAILGSKAKSIESKIRSYGKKHYNLDLQTGESEKIDWEQVFLEYYDGETMGERCDEIILEPEDANKENNMSNEEQMKALSDENKSLKDKITELEKSSGVAAAKIADLEKNSSEAKVELETLRKYKTDREAADARADKIKAIKAKLTEASIEDNVDSDPDYWLGLSDDLLAKTIVRITDAKKKATAEKSKVNVPQITNDKTSEVDIIREGLKDMKTNRGKK